jgi:hypothetical protein
MATSGSAAKLKALEQSVPSSTFGGASSSARLTHRKSLIEVLNEKGGNRALRAACERIGRPGLYEAPDEQELRGLYDPRNRRRGESRRRRRLERGWLRVEREVVEMRHSSLGGSLEVSHSSNLAYSSHMTRRY